MKDMGFRNPRAALGSFDGRKRGERVSAIDICKRAALTHSQERTRVRGTGTTSIESAMRLLSRPPWVVTYWALFL